MVIVLKNTIAKGHRQLVLSRLAASLTGSNLSCAMKDDRTGFPYGTRPSIRDPRQPECDTLSCPSIQRLQEALQQLVEHGMLLPMHAVPRVGHS